MKRRFVASLMFVTAAILMAPATSQAASCPNPGDSQTDASGSCAFGSNASTPPTSVNGGADNGSSSFGFGDIDALIQTLIG